VPRAFIQKKHLVMELQEICEKIDANWGCLLKQLQEKRDNRPRAIIKDITRYCSKFCGYVLVKTNI